MVSGGSSTLIFRKQTFSSPSTLNSPQKSGKGWSRSSRPGASAERRLSAGIDGLTSLTPQSTKRSGRNGSSDGCMRSTPRWVADGLWFRKKSAGWFALNLGLRIRSRTDSTALLGTIFAFCSTTLTVAVPASTTRLLNCRPSFSTKCITPRTVNFGLLRILVPEWWGQDNHFSDGLQSLEEDSFTEDTLKAKPLH